MAAGGADKPGPEIRAQDVGADARDRRGERDGRAVSAFGRADRPAPVDGLVLGQIAQRRN